ncbi:MAG: methyltransferase [Bacteroidota bacterium]|jgi:SAM-dependent methyltransferase
MSEFLSSGYWNDRYLNGNTGWDLGTVSPPIEAYCDQLTNKEYRILIPGCGSGYEGEYFFAKGFRNVHLLDFSPEIIERFKKHNPLFPDDQLFVRDFFKHEGIYDLIIEQTLFCALDPSLRNDYAEKAAELLAEGGKLVGLLFNREFEGGPPFGGNAEEYRQTFEPFFREISMHPCYNSVPPRQGTELFIQLIK